MCPNDGFQTVDARLYGKGSDDPLVGTVFEGRYRIEARVSAGGMGAVYRATQLAVNRPVALKLLSAELARDLKAVARFQQEARSVAALRHPNTVRLFDFGQGEGGRLYLVMEFLEGESLGELIDREAPLDPGRIIEIVRQICDALAEAHESGIIHRDLKPDNLIVTRVGLKRDFVKLVDFGIAKVQAVLDRAKQELTGEGLVLGSPGYMAPEQITSVGIEPATDLYSLGALMYEMVTGLPPFVGETPFQVCIQHLNQAPAHPTMDGRRLDGPLIDLILQLLQKDPKRRPRSAAAVLEALEECEAQPIYAYRPPERDPEIRRARLEAPTMMATGQGPLDIPLHSPVTRASAAIGKSTIGIAITPEMRQAGGHRFWITLLAVLLVAGGGAAAWFFGVQGGRFGGEPATQSPAVAEGPEAERVEEGPAAERPAEPADTAAIGAGATEPVQAPADTAADAGQAPRPDAEAPTGLVEAEADAGPTEPAAPDAAAAAAADVASEPDTAGLVAGQPEIQWVDLDTSPTGANVFVNGKRVGKTPYRLEWPTDGKPPKVVLKRWNYENAYLRLTDKDAGTTKKVSLEPEYLYEGQQNRYR